jgi:hypothetical protein
VSGQIAQCTCCTKLKAIHRSCQRTPTHLSQGLAVLNRVPFFKADSHVLVLPAGKVGEDGHAAHCSHARLGRVHRRALHSNERALQQQTRMPGQTLNLLQGVNCISTHMCPDLPIKKTARSPHPGACHSARSADNKNTARAPQKSPRATQQASRTAPSRTSADLPIIGKQPKAPCASPPTKHTHINK